MNEHILTIDDVKNKKESIQNLTEEDIFFFQGVINIINKFNELTTLNELKEISVSMFIHELALPIQSLMFSKSIIRNIIQTHSIDNKNKQEILEILKKQGDDLEQLQILTSIFRTGFGKFDISKNIIKALVFPKKEIEKIVDSLKTESVVNKNININLSIDEMDSMYIDIDQFKQVFYNLLKNAIRYSTKNSNDIQIYYNRSILDLENSNTFKIYDILTFQNWGIGFEKNEVEHIFKIGFRGKKAIFTQPGSGIGLYVVEQIMSAHGGKVIISNLNNPTEIKIFFPRL